MTLTNHTGIQNPADVISALTQTTHTPSHEAKPTSSEDVAPVAEDTIHGSDSDDGTDDGTDDCGDDENDEQPSIPSNEERPEGWTMGLYSRLKRLVVEAKGEASQPVVRFIKKYLRGTKLIFVVGQSGTGKSTIISEVTGQDLPIGKTIKSGTKNHHVCPGIIDGEQYLFIDTAGFGASDMDDMDNFSDIITCLDALSPFVTVAGILFVYGGGQDRMMQHDLKTIQWVKCFCGPEFYRHITIVTTKWDSWSDEHFEEAWARLPSLLDDPSIADILNPSPANSQRYHGGDVYHHSIKRDKADPSAPPQRLSRKKCAAERADEIRTMIKNRYKEAPRVKLQVMREMANKVPWHETEAAKVLKNTPADIKLDIKDGLLQVSVVEGARSMTGGTTQQKATTLPSPATPLPSPATPLPPSAGAKPDAQQHQSKSSSDDKTEPKPKHDAHRPGTSWPNGFFQWLEIAKQLAVFFWKARRASPENNGESGGPRTQSNTWVGLWETLQDWWSGHPKTS